MPNFAANTTRLSVRAIAHEWAQETEHHPDTIEQSLLTWWRERWRYAFQEGLDDARDEEEEDQIEEEAGFIPSDVTDEMPRWVLRGYCIENGYRPPRFWFPEEYRETALAGAETRCRDWLSTLAVSGLKEKSKEEYWREARASFRGLSRRGFERAWAASVPPEWREPGRRRNARARG